MAKKGIEEMISEIEIFIDNCKYQPLSSSKIVVPKDDLEQMLNELKLKLPNEIERCKKIMRNKEAILADARTRADSIITESVAEANKLVDQSQIVELASLGIRQSPLGERVTLPTFGASGRQERLNCWEKNRR